MGLVKILAALGLGVAMLAGVQTAWMGVMREAIRSNQANVGSMRVGPSPDFAANARANGIAEALLPKGGMIDTRRGQQLAIEGAARRVDLMNRAALSHVPLPPRGIPGVRR